MTEIFAILTVAVFFILWLILWLPLAIPCALKLQWRPFQPSSAAQKLPLLASLYLIAPLVLWKFCQFEGRTFAVYGMPLCSALFASMGWGLVFGSLSLAALFLIQHQVGWLQFSECDQLAKIQSLKFRIPTALPQILLMLVLALWIGWTEELIFRGFLQNQLQRDLPIWIAATIASLIFALLHGVWEGKAVIPQLPGLWLMGMVLVLARWVDQNNLGLAWGLHAGWVWVIASLDLLQLTNYSSKAPTWMTGVENKPLAGLIGLLFLLGTAGCLSLL